MAVSSGIDATTAAAMLTALDGGAAFSVTTPLKCLWLTAVRTAANGTDTEVSTGSGYTAGTGFSGVTFAAPTTSTTGATALSSVTASVSNMPACTWAGNKIVDSTGTPKVTYFATLATPKTVNLGDTVSIASGSWQGSLLAT